MISIGINLKQLRKEQGLSIRALADQITISHNTLAAYERNDIVPTILNAEKISNFFHVPLEYLLYGEKSLAEFNDMELLRLAKEIDSLNGNDCILVKKYMKKIIKNTKERNQLISESED